VYTRVAAVRRSVVALTGYTRADAHTREPIIHIRRRLRKLSTVFNYRRRRGRLNVIKTNARLRVRNGNVRANAGEGGSGNGARYGNTVKVET